MTNLSIKIENDLKGEAQKFADELGISLSSLIKMLLKNVVRTGRLDIETRPRYHDAPEQGDIEFKNLNEATEYFKELAENDGKMA